ncbi:hypothetical protein [Actinomadura madurae]|uniref:hypothetical protein n=1 Tax=Actinomadura madurae TaxID=1993 RepID=UPI0020D22652|nr:hypothetical protein [Actinomadura madurae]MCQ0014011.1 hypothetical protein [Actinomadura madurae]
MTWDFDHSLQPIVARFETDAWDVAFRLAKQNPFGTGPILLPFLSADVARLFADWLYRLKSAQEIARTWFGRHGLAAVPYLVPDALGKRVGPRRNAVKALRFIEGTSPRRPASTGTRPRRRSPPSSPPRRPTRPPPNPRTRRRPCPSGWTRARCPDPRCEGAGSSRPTRSATCCSP